MNSMTSNPPHCVEEYKETLTRYQRAQQLEAAAMGHLKPVLNDRVVPHWLEGGEQFWYVREVRENSKASSDHAREFRLVDAASASNQQAFDHQILARALANASGETVVAADLPFTHIDLNPQASRLSFHAFGKRWQFDPERQTCEPVTDLPADWKVSPDGRKAVFRRDNNLWLRDLIANTEKPLTDDGEPFYVYAGTPTVYGRQEAFSVEAIWSPDSSRVFTVVIDTRQVEIAPPLVRHVPPNGALRPDIIGPDRRMAMPGDEHVEGYYFFSIDVNSGERIQADYRLCPVFRPPYVGFFSGGRGWWSPDNRRAYFIDLSRDGLTGRLLEFDTTTGVTRVLIEEKSATGIHFIPMTHLGVILKPLSNGRELLWYSERSGWAHLYLYDLDTGELKHPVTSGEFMLRNLLHIDEDRRELVIQTAGRTPGRNAYYRDICRVNLDTGELTELLASDHEYSVCDLRDRGGFVATTGVSPSGNYMVATRSRVDDSPLSLLLDRQGQVLMELESADISGLPAHWQWPEPVTLKAADGQTDLYGVVFRPSDFSPDKSYPVLDFSSNGDHMPAGSFGSCYMPGLSYFPPAAYAELGFIVVLIRPRGTGLRSVAFQRDTDTPLLYSGHLDDCMAGIQQLAERYPYMDTERVGLGGYTSPATSIVGMFKYPDFYKVAVSSNSVAEIRLVWSGLGETACTDDIPYEDFFHYDKLACKLKGKLLMVIGMLDNVAPPACSFRVVEALQKANKDFDMLVLPNYVHAGYSSYVTRRTWDYFVQHLQGIEPPKNFELPRDWDTEDVTLIGV